MSCLMRSLTTLETFHRSTSWRWVLIEAAFEIGMVVRDEEGRFTGRDCAARDSSYNCECDPGLPGICLTKFTSGGQGDPYVVTPREVRAALDAYDRWEGDLASIIVQQPKEWFTGEAFRVGDSIDDAYIPAPMGAEGTQDFLAFVRFLRSSAADGFFVDN